MTVKLKYTGPDPKVFAELGELQPGGHFEVADDRLDGFMRRADIEHVGKCPKAPCRCGQPPQPDQEAGSAPDTADAGTDAGQ